MLMVEGCTVMSPWQCLLCQWQLSELSVQNSLIVLFHMCERTPMHPCGFLSFSSCNMFKWSLFFSARVCLLYTTPQQQVIYMKWLLLVVFAWQEIGAFHLASASKVLMSPY